MILRNGRIIRSIYSLVSGMQREVFILSNGESFFTWNVQFNAATTRKETLSCDYQQDDGSMQKGVLYRTVESSEVTFCASPASVRVGMQGQLSSPNDIFFEVTIS